MKWRTVFKWDGVYILFTIPGTCVENYWFREVIIQVERIMNYQLARPTEFRANRIIWIGSTRWYYASKIRVEVLVPFHLNDLAKVFESDHELDLKGFSFWTIPEKIQTGGLRIWNFQGYHRNSMWNFQGLIKSKVEFSRVTKKT